MEEGKEEREREGLRDWTRVAREFRREGETVKEGPAGRRGKRKKKRENQLKLPESPNDAR